jgi:hypothetical protein
METIKLLKTMESKNWVTFNVNAYLVPRTYEIPVIKI